MSAWALPTQITVAGKPFDIRSDYRAVLDAITALNDPDLDQRERAVAALAILVPDWQQLPDATEAFSAVMEFINLGKPIPENQPPKPQLVDWEKDTDLIAPAVDKVLGFSCRRCEYLHWWEFIGAYSNIGRGLFSEVVNVRNKRAKGKKLEKYEQDFVRENPELVSVTKQLSDAEEEFFKRLGV